MNKLMYFQYNMAYQNAIDYMSKLYDRYKNESNIRTLMVKEYRKNHLDPDSKAIRYEFKVKCTADGLYSMSRICHWEKNIEEIIPVYRKYREIPIFFFPSERGGINSSRSGAFGDRIDHTLYDLKMHFTVMSEECHLKKAYHRRKTSFWLKHMASFENIVDWLGIEGIFTDKDYNVYDLEYDDSRIISSYKSSSEYQSEWSPSYYNNLKEKILEFYQRNCGV